MGRKRTGVTQSTDQKVAVVPYSSGVQRPMRARPILTEHPHPRWAVPVDRDQARAVFASRCSAALLRVTLPLASCPAAAQAKEMGGGHPDEVRRHSLDPRLKPGIDKRRALGF